MDLTLVTSGESHGPGITAVIVGPARRASRSIARRSARDLARRQAGLRAQPAPADRAGRRRDPGRRPARAHARRAARADRAQPRPRQLGRGDERLAGHRGGARRGRRAPQPQGAAAAARPRRPLGRHEVRPRRRAQRARARLGARDLRARRRRARSRRGCSSCSASACSAACSRSATSRRRPTPATRTAFDRARDERDRLLGSRDVETRMLAAIDAARGRSRHARRHHRDPRLRLPARARLAHRAAPAPRRAPRRRRGRHPGHEGRRDRRCVRQRAPAGLGGARRAALRRRARLLARDATAPAASRAACRTASRSSCASR